MTIEGVVSIPEVTRLRAIAAIQIASTEEVALSGALNSSLLRAGFSDWRLSGYSNLERTQQNCTNERKHGKDRQHLKPQGKVHVMCSLLVEVAQV